MIICARSLIGVRRARDTKTVPDEDSLIGNNRVESALRLVGALLWFWFSYGSTREGRDLALKALSASSGNSIHMRPRQGAQYRWFSAVLAGRYRASQASTGRSTHHPAFNRGASWTGLVIAVSRNGFSL